MSGPVALVPRLGAIDAVALLAGAPTVVASLRVATGFGSITTPLPATRATSACAGAASFVFCNNSAGEIRRYKAAAGSEPPRFESDNFITRPRPGSMIAAAAIGDHPVVAYLRDRTTSEGNTTEAYLTSDDGTEVRLSEDGAGATSVALAPHNGALLAVYVDARRAMTPVHARGVSLTPKPTLGKDVVLFIAGSAETHTRVDLGVKTNGPAYALLPIARDVAFGLAVAKVDHEPATDAHVEWIDYANGLDPAPIAATTSGPSVYVARIRPIAAAFGSPRTLEVGTVDTGAFVPLGIISTHGSPTEVAMTSDGAGGFVIAYTDPTGGFIERHACGHR